MIFVATAPAVTTYTVTYDANGGTGSMADATGVSGDYVLLACGFTAPDGKQFKAWSVGSTEKAAGETINVTANTTVTAIWEDIPHTHVYDQTVATSKYKVSSATCKKKAVYYKSCVCGEKGQTTFESGSLAAHTYKTKLVKATTTANGKKSLVCSVCDHVKSTGTIYYAKTFTLSTTSYKYNGKVKTPSVTVKDANGTKLTKNTHYTVKYASGRKYVGKYKVTVTMKGNYSGTKTLYLTVNPPKTSVSKLSAAKKSLKVTIKKKSSQVTGYQIEYSTSKSFKSKYTKSRTVKSYKTTSTTLKSLKAKKTYYVRVRTYKNVNGKKYYSGWSSYKYKKTK